MRDTVKSKGEFYNSMANALESLDEGTGAVLLSKGIRLLNDLIGSIRKNKLTKAQHVMFLLADIITWCEIANALCHKAEDSKKEFLNASARLFVKEAIEKLYINAMAIAYGCGKEMKEIGSAVKELGNSNILRSYLSDMDLISSELLSR
jgi:hypothetical protein